MNNNYTGEQGFLPQEPKYTFPYVFDVLNLKSEYFYWPSFLKMPKNVILDVFEVIFLCGLIHYGKKN